MEGIRAKVWDRGGGGEIRNREFLGSVLHIAPKNPIFSLVWWYSRFFYSVLKKIRENGDKRKPTVAR